MIANRYEVHEELGAGGMGTVYRGIDTRNEQPVAIKLLKPEAIASDPDILERFSREGEALRQLNHPNIVKMLDAVEDSGKHYLIIEYISGGDLHALLKQQPTMPINQIVQIALDLVDALTRAHRLNIIHRDLKPGNVLIADDGTPRLTDFGVAHMGMMERVTDTDVAVGTVDYLAPEALSDETIDARADIWSFGVMLFEMVAGLRPFTGKMAAQVLTAVLTQPIPDLEALRSDCPVALVDLIYRMLEKDQNSRIASIRHVGAALEDILQGRTHHTPPETRFSSPIPDIIDRLKHNLPVQTTPFVGREAELSELRKLVNDPNIRLITILAPGGMGKTRLALEAAGQIATSLHDMGGSRGDGVYFVELAPLSDPANIVFAIAEAIGYQFQSDERDPRQQILDFLREKQMMLLLDNWEHLLEGTSLVTDILQTASQVQILATSRQRLNQPGETLFHLVGMDFPDWQTPEDALNYAAVKLFMNSALRAQPGFELTDDNLDYVARICRQVQGMPLGIVLAASWLGMLSPEEIDGEIQQAIDFLETEAGEVPERQRSIRVILEYSWQQMTNAEQDVFMKLSVFRGGFTREAAQAVAGADLRILMSLLNHSLIRRDANSGRYEIHELLRQYGLMQLEISGNIEATYTQHANYYNEFMRGWWGQLKGHRQIEALNTIDPEFENIRHAWHHLVELQVVELREFVSSIWFFLIMRNRQNEGRDLFTKAMDTFRLLPQSENRDIIVGHLTARLSWVITHLDSPQEGKNIAQEAIRRLEKHNCVEETIMAYESLAISEGFARNWIPSQKAAGQGLDLAKSNNHYWGISRHLYWLGLAYLGKEDFETALSIGNQCYQAASAIGDAWIMANATGLLLGRTTKALRKYATAKRSYQEALSIYKELNMIWGIGRMYQHLGEISFLEEDYHQASDHFQQALQLFLSTGTEYEIQRSSVSWSEALIKQGRISVAVALLTCVQEASSHSRILETIVSLLGETRTQLTVAVYEDAQERGKALELEVLLKELLDEFEPLTR